MVSPEDKVNDQWVNLSSVLTTAMEQYIPKKSMLRSSHLLTKKSEKKLKRRIEHGEDLWSPQKVSTVTYTAHS